MDDAIANWQWLMPLSRRVDAVVIAPRTDSSFGFLTHGFDRTRHFDPSIADQTSGQFEASWRSSYGDGSLDCVAAPRSNRTGPGWRADEGMLSTVRRSLRPGHGVFVAIEQIRGPESGSRFRGLFGPRKASMIRSAGFSQIRSFYMVSAPSLALHFVPIDRRMILAWDSAMESAGVRSSIRQLVINMGLHALLFRFRLIVARA